ncbi:soluble lamin-associated protein of 75 kDa isoform X1 [Pleurodeles waltl]|uniref:soluble lamin-associated protein of 75 kDa isoform X1 n=1 Tax=Pleurodeles waltl TaxID=8319 RepID=UPI003709B05D
MPEAGSGGLLSSSSRTEHHPGGCCTVWEMSFPVDILDDCSHEDLENSAEDYLSDLRSGDPGNPEFFSTPGKSDIPISLSMVGFVPLYGGDQTHKVLALFAPEDTLTAVALYLADQWWAIEDIVRTSSPQREGLHKVRSLGERVVLYVLNRIIYRKLEMTKNEVPFLCHGSADYAKIMWKNGEAIGFYSVKPSGSICNSYLTQRYQLPVLDTMFVRRRHREKDFGLQMLEDFVDSFSEDTLGLRYPVSSSTYAVCKQYLEKYPGDQELLWEVEGVGHWFQRTRIASRIQKETPSIVGASPSENTPAVTEDSSQKSSTEPEDSSQKSSTEPEDSSQKSSTEPESGSEQNTSSPHKDNTEQIKVDTSRELNAAETRANIPEDYDITPVSTRTRSSQLKRPKIGRRLQEPDEVATPQEDYSITLNAEGDRSEALEHASANAKEFQENRTEQPSDEITANVVQERAPPIGHEEREEIGKPPRENLEDEGTTEQKSLISEIVEEMLANEKETGDVFSDGEISLEFENPDEERCTITFPVILHSFGCSLDTSTNQNTGPESITENPLEAGKRAGNVVMDGEVTFEHENPSEEDERTSISAVGDLFSTSAGTSPDQAISETDMEISCPDHTSLKTDENVANDIKVPEDKTALESTDADAVLQCEEPSDNGLPNSKAMEGEALKECTVPDAPPDVVPLKQDTLQVSLHGAFESLEAYEGLRQGSVVLVELKDVSFQHHIDGHKSQSDEQSEESTVEKVVESSSEEAETEAPARERRGLRRKATGQRGRPRKRGRLAA